MFNNIGKKIKSLAKISCWINIILFLIVGLSIFSEGDEIGLFIGIFGAFISWVGSWLMFGFGEIIDCLQKITVSTQHHPRTNYSTQNTYSSPANSTNDYLRKLKETGLISDEEYEQYRGEL